jgi:hypothetical protein
LGRCEKGISSWMGCILLPIMGMCQGEILGEFYRQIIQGGLVCKVRKAVLL